MVSNPFGDIFEDNPPKCLFWLIVGFFLDFCWNFWFMSCCYDFCQKFWRDAPLGVQDGDGEGLS